MHSQCRKSSIRRFLGVLFLGSLTLCLWLGHVSLTNWQVRFGSVATATAPDAKQLVQQGVIRYQAGDIQGAITAWETALTAYRNNNHANEAIVLEDLARAYQLIGKSAQAISSWERAISDYRELGNLQQVGRMLVEQAQTYSSLGQSRKAIALLCGESAQSCRQDSALQIVRAQKDRQGEAAALGSLGDAYRLRGEYSKAIASIQASLKIANELKNPAYRSSALNSLGNANISQAQINYYRADSAEQREESNEVEKFKQAALSYDAAALKNFQDSLELARTQNDLQGQMRALLNSIPPYYRRQANPDAAAALQQAQSLLARLPDSQDKAYAAINLAHLLQPVVLEETSAQTQCLKPELESKAVQLLLQAASIAQSIQDRRSESFALGELGHIYECRQDYKQALNLTQQARLAADQNLLAKDSLYLWDWQAGRIFNAQQQDANALKAYERAVNTLENIRSDILNANRDLQFDFRDTVNPIYRELAELKLEQASLLTKSPVKNVKELLNSALDTIDSLKLAELQNYFGNECVITALNQERVDLAGEGTATAVFSSIIFKNRAAILVSLPDGEKKSAWIDVERKTLIQEINDFRIGLERFTDYTYDPIPAQKLYNKIIRPFAADLDRAQIKTLVFIQDGILRSVPMAALHDGKQFLVQKYAIATTPSLTLVDPKAINRKGLRALAVGLTKDATVNGREFQALVNVGPEIKEVGTAFPGSKQLLDKDFTRDRLQQELSKTAYPIIHIATHGEFGTDPEDTFLVTGNNGKLTIADLDAAIRSLGRGSNSVELLALTACETATGDDRAALGLAGVAAQAGVKSVLASLWSVQDESIVNLVTTFYTSLRNSNTTKAEALRTAQQALLNSKDYAHPAYWAPFILIGNWL